MLQRRVSGEGRSAMVNGPNGPIAVTTFERLDSDMGTPTQPTRPAPDRRVGRAKLMIGLCNVACSHQARGAMLPFCRAGAGLNCKTAPAVSTRSHPAARRKGLGGLLFCPPLGRNALSSSANASQPTTTLDLAHGKDHMGELTRRNIMAGAAAVAVAPLAFGRTAHAAAPPAGKQAPAFYRYKVGDYELTQISDGGRTFPMPDGFVRNIPKEQALAAGEAAYMPKGQVTVTFNPVVINTGSKLILIDTGFPAGAGPTIGLFQPNLAAAGIDAKAIDIVVLSHLHPDHINGVKTADGGLAFPNAEIKAPAPDWAFWMSDDNMSKAANDMMKGYFANTRKVLSDTAGKGPPTPCG